MKIKKSDFTGTGKVFKFTLRQSLISKSSIIMIIVMLLTSAGTMLLSTLNANSGVLKESRAGTLYIVNETKFEVTGEEITRANEVFSGLNVVESEKTLDEVRDVLDNSDEILNAAAYITYDKKNETYLVNLFTGKDSRLSALEVEYLSSALLSAFSEARFKAADASERQLKTVMTPHSAELKSLDDYVNNVEKTSFSTSYAINFIYTFLLFMLIMYSATYIIRSIIDEKTSSLVDTLMISIKPLALIIGKILATMCLMVLNLAALALGIGLTYTVMLLLPPGVIDAKAAFASMNLSGALANLSWYSIIIMLVSVMLGYASYSIVAGLSGTCCTNLEDAGMANLATMLLCYFGYFGSLATTGMQGRTASAVLSLIPFLSVFTAPVRYTMGQISFGVLCVSWLIQGVIAALLFAFCARVYQSLLMYKGNRIKLKQLVMMAKVSNRRAGL